MITVTFEKVISYFCFFHQINFQFDFSFLFRRSKETIFCPVAFLDFNLKVFHSKVSHQDRKKRVIRSIGLFLKGLGDYFPYKRIQSNHSLGYFWKVWVTICLTKEAKVTTVWAFLKGLGDNFPYKSYQRKHRFLESAIASRQSSLCEGKTTLLK